MSAVRLRPPFLEFQGTGGNDPVWRSVYQPPRCCKWRVELWARRGKLKHWHSVKCEDAIDIDAFVEQHLKEITGEFMTEFARAVEDKLVMLKLAGKHADAYDIESKVPRFGYEAYEN